MSIKVVRPKPEDKPSLGTNQLQCGVIYERVNGGTCRYYMHTVKGQINIESGVFRLETASTTDRWIEVDAEIILKEKS